MGILALAADERAKDVHITEVYQSVSAVAINLILPIHDPELLPKKYRRCKKSL